MAESRKRRIGMWAWLAVAGFMLLFAGYLGARQENSEIDQRFVGVWYCTGSPGDQPPDEQQQIVATCVDPLLRLQ
jgi:hypothetical protein